MRNQKPVWVGFVIKAPKSLLTSAWSFYTKPLGSPEICDEEHAPCAVGKAGGLTTVRPPTLLILWEVSACPQPGPPLAGSPGTPGKLRLVPRKPSRAARTSLSAVEQWDMGVVSESRDPCVKSQICHPQRENHDHPQECGHAGATASTAGRCFQSGDQPEGGTILPLSGIRSPTRRIMWPVIYWIYCNIGHSNWLNLKVTACDNTTPGPVIWSTVALLTMPKPLCGSQQTLENS